MNAWRRGEVFECKAFDGKAWLKVIELTACIEAEPARLSSPAPG